MALPKLPNTETMSVSEARRQFSDTLDRVRRREARVIVEKSGIPVGAIVSMDDLEDLQRLQQRRGEAQRVLADARAGFAGIPEAETEGEVWNAIAEVEAGHRSRRDTGGVGRE